MAATEQEKARFLARARKMAKRLRADVTIPRRTDAVQDLVIAAMAKQPKRIVARDDGTYKHK